MPHFPSRQPCFSQVSVTCRAGAHREGTGAMAAVLIPFSAQLSKSLAQRGVSLQCAAAAAMDCGNMRSLAVTPECAYSPPTTIRRDETCARPLVLPGTVTTISGKTRANRTCRVKKRQSRALWMLLLGGSDPPGGDVGGGQDGGGGRWDGGGSDGGSSDGSEEDGGWHRRVAQSLGVCCGPYFDTTWVWHVCCFLCMMNTALHLAAAQRACVGV